MGEQLHKIRAIIFDLDDTLFDCSGQLVASAQKRAAIAMIKAGLPGTAGLVLKKQLELLKRLGPRINVFDEICTELGIKEKQAEKIVNAALEAYNSDAVEDIRLFGGVKQMLARFKKKGMKTAIVSSGLHNRQMKKIELLGLKNAVDLIVVHDIEKGNSKEHAFKKVLAELKLKPSEVVSVGDRIQSEIKISNALGMTTVRLLHGRYKKLLPKNDLEQSDFEIKKITDLEKKIREMEKNGSGKKSNGLRVVAIGGGTGLPLVLSSLKQYTKNITAIVTVTDCGRSTGILRKEFGIPAPGDLRNCLIALGKSEKLLLDLFNYRFGGSMLKDLSFGNLLLVALTKTTGSFENAVKVAGKILAIEGQVLPSTLQNVHICTELEDGTVFSNEDALIQRDALPAKLAKRARIKKVFLKPANAKILSEARKAILKADLIIIGPGSLFTSVITNLLVKGMKEAIKKSNAKKVFVANVMTQVNQTHGLKLSGHINAIEKYLGKGIIDFVVFNNKKPNKQILGKYLAEQSFFVENDLKQAKRKPKLIGANLVETPVFSAKKATKQRLLRHDPKKLGKILLSIFCPLEKLENPLSRVN